MLTQKTVYQIGRSALSRAGGREVYRTSAKTVSFAESRIIHDVPSKVTKTQVTTSQKPITEFVGGTRVFSRGKIIGEGTVDLRPTLNRVNNGELISYRNDGAIFSNYEGMLPQHPRGYYREYVHPTPNVNLPGPQRIIVGKQGEIYYTPDHYQSFIPLSGG